MDSDSARPDGRTPVVLLRTSDSEVVAVANTPPGEGWVAAASVLAAKAGPLLQKLGVREPSSVSMRVFQMRSDDLQAWDSLQRVSSGNGYAYGTVLDRNGKFAKNLSIREVRGLPVQAPGFDPVSLATLAAVQQLQAQVEQLTDLVRDVKATADQILQFIHGQQQAAVLSAIETLRQVHASQLAGGVTDLDWSRIAVLEQPLKEQHRQIVRELLALSEKLRFVTMEQAKDSQRVDPQRVVELFDLDKYVLQGLARYYDLMLSAKESRGELTLDQVQECRETLRHYVRSLEEARDAVLNADTEPADRSNWRRVMERDGMFAGLVGGAHKDRKRRSAAIEARRAIQQNVREVQLGSHEIEGPDVASSLAG